MLSKEQRKQALSKFKEQKTPLGIYAVRSTATGTVWVGASRNLDATRNGIWFTLRTGVHHDNLLQVEWNQHGESTFQYEILEKFEDVLPLAVTDLLNDKRKHWATQLHARTLL